VVVVGLTPLRGGRENLRPTTAAPTLCSLDGPLKGVVCSLPPFFLVRLSSFAARNPTRFARCKIKKATNDSEACLSIGLAIFQ
jgi:hypothetical protein